MTTADLQHEYETFYVTKPELPDDEVTRISDKLLGAIERLKGSLLVSEDWGRRKLSYPISARTTGTTSTSTTSVLRRSRSSSSDRWGSRTTSSGSSR